MKKIMIVDDSALMRRVESDILNSDGRFEVTATAKNGREALELLEKQTFDLIILDINMPVMDGLQFMEELNKRSMHEKVVITSTLAVDGGGVTIRALELGAVDFIQKPQNASEMRNGTFVSMFLQIVDQASNVNKKQLASVIKNYQFIDKNLSDDSSD